MANEKEFKVPEGPTSENAQGVHYGDACGICGGPCVVGSKGLYCPKCQPNKALNEVGIVAAGIPEAVQRKRKPAPEKIGSDLLKNVIEAVPESGDNAEHELLSIVKEVLQWCKVTNKGAEWKTSHERIKEIREAVDCYESVSQPSQVKREFTELEAAQAEYIALLLMEIDSLVGIAHVHGWKSQLVELGKRCRDRVVELQKHKKP